jgi:hypothetical protein
MLNGVVMQNMTKNVIHKASHVDLNTNEQQQQQQEKAINTIEIDEPGISSTAGIHKHTSTTGKCDWCQRSARS